MMRDEVRETFDKLGDTIIGEMLIVKDLITDRDRWKHRAKIYQNLCQGLLAVNMAMVGSHMVQRRMKKGKQNLKRG